MHSNMPWVRRRRSHALLCLCGAALLLAASANPFGRREGLSTLLHDNAEHDAEQAPVPGSGWRSSPSYCEATVPDSNPLSFGERYGPTAIVAGASEGLGRSWAEAIAARGVNLILIARRADKLEATAEATAAALDGVVEMASVPDLSKAVVRR